MGRRTGSLIVALLTSAAMVAGMSPAAAVTQYSWQGDDYSYNGVSNGLDYVYICDGESDGHGVHADYQVWGSSTDQMVRNENGNGTCIRSGLYPEGIYRHRAVEEIPFGEDPKGPYVYPYGA